jgi:hypothetical protein
MEPFRSASASTCGIGDQFPCVGTGVNLIYCSWRYEGNPLFAALDQGSSGLGSCSRNQYINGRPVRLAFSFMTELLDC